MCAGVDSSDRLIYYTLLRCDLDRSQYPETEALAARLLFKKYGAFRCVAIFLLLPHDRAIVGTGQYNKGVRAYGSPDRCRDGPQRVARRHDTPAQARMRVRISLHRPAEMPHRTKRCRRRDADCRPEGELREKAKKKRNLRGLRLKIHQRRRFWRSAPVPEGQ